MCVLIIQAGKKRIVFFYHYESPFALKREQVKELLRLASLDNHGKTYKQIDGVDMGSPLGPTLAMTFMFCMEEEWLADCSLEITPFLIKGMLMIVF